MEWVGSVDVRPDDIDGPRALVVAWSLARHAQCNSVVQATDRDVRHLGVRRGPLASKRPWTRQPPAGRCLKKGQIVLIKLDVFRKSKEFSWM